jgi:electron transfer flavoprotein alpha/beta subunit
LETPSPGRASRAALDLACAVGAPARVVVLAAGGPAANEAVELARSRTAVTRVLHIGTSTLDQTDFLTMGMVLAEAARHLEATVVLTGERSDVEGQGLVPAALAHHLRAPLLSRVLTFRPTGAPGTVEVTVRTGGLLCSLACPVPLVLSVAADRPVPRLAETPSPLAVELLPLPTLGLDPSRLVPRPDLLGQLIPAPAAPVVQLDLAQAKAALWRHG